jgi:hypothetical protein
MKASLTPKVSGWFDHSQEEPGNFLQVQSGLAVLFPMFIAPVLSTLEKLIPPNRCIPTVFCPAVR